MTPPLYPALKSNIWVAFYPGHFAKRNPFKKFADWWQKVPQGGWVNCPASPCPLSVLPFGFLKKPFPSTIAHKAPNTAFQSLGGIQMPSVPQDRHRSPHRGRHGALQFWIVVYNADGRSSAEKDSTKICCLLSNFLNLLGVLSLPQRMTL